jgi:hypothetical protein
MDKLKKLEKKLHKKAFPKKMLAPSPFQVIEASKKKPKKVHRFKNEATAIIFRSAKLTEGKTALLGSREINGKIVYEVEVY